MQNRNVRITYPDSPDGTLEIDVVDGMEMSIMLTLSDLQYYAKDGVVKVLQNRYAGPGYSNFLYSQTAHIILNKGDKPDKSEETVINTTSTPMGED